MITDETELIIPGYDPNNPRSYPGDIKPGYYNKTKVKKLLKKHRDNLGVCLSNGRLAAS
jgi:hypothetical protein